MAFFNTPAQVKQVPIYNQQQTNVLDQLRGLGLQGLQNQSQFNFEPIAQQARTQFKTQTIPTIAERFQNITPNSSDRGSSGLIGSLGAAGAGLEQGLAALKSQYGLQQQNQQNSLYQNLLGLGLMPQTENFYSGEQPGFLESAGGAAGSTLLQLLPLLLGGVFGGPVGAAAGGATGSGLSVLLSSLGSR